MTKTYKRNKQFKEAVSVYRFALTKWAWREKKTVTPPVYRRLQIVENVEVLIMEWEIKSGFLPWKLSWFFITPPDEWIKKVLAWS
jgi:hypothetical protein